MQTQLAAVAARQPTTGDPTIWRVGDALWAGLQPLPVVDKPRKKPGCHRNDDRPILDGLIWLARTRAQWTAWPRALFGPKSTAHDRLQEWVEYGCLERAWARLLVVCDDDLDLPWEWQPADGCLANRRRPGPPPPTAVNVAASATY